MRFFIAFMRYLDDDIFFAVVLVRVYAVPGD